MLGSPDFKDFSRQMSNVCVQNFLNSINSWWFYCPLFSICHRFGQPKFNIRPSTSKLSLKSDKSCRHLWLSRGYVHFLDKIICFSRSINGFLILYAKVALIYILDEGSTSPKAPPRDRRRDRSATRSSTSNLSSTLGSEGVKQQQPISHGLPPTPKVHMGACFSKVL